MDGLIEVEQFNDDTDPVLPLLLLLHRYCCCCSSSSTHDEDDGLENNANPVLVDSIRFDLQWIRSKSTIVK